MTDDFYRLLHEILRRPPDPFSSPTCVLVYCTEVVVLLKGARDLGKERRDAWLSRLRVTSASNVRTSARATCLEAVIDAVALSPNDATRLIVWIEKDPLPPPHCIHFWSAIFLEMVLQHEQTARVTMDLHTKIQNFRTLCSEPDPFHWSSRNF